MTAKTRTAAIAAAVAAALALPGIASADTPAYTPTLSLTAPCTENRDTSGTQYDVRLCDVTDIDQFRSGLENDGGAYCGPTSLFNSLMYLATEVGAPIDFGGGLKVADLDPRDPSQYSKITTITGWLGWKSKYDGGTKMGTCWRRSRTSRPARSPRAGASRAATSTTATSPTSARRSRSA